MYAHVILYSFVHDSALSSRSKKTFEFPDGFNHAFGLDRFKLPEMLFQPNVYDIASKKTEEKSEQEDQEASEDKDKEKEKETEETEKDNAMQVDQEKDSKFVGVHDMVYNSINNCDIDLRPLLFNNVVVTGGDTLFKGFNERLNHELPLKAPGVSCDTRRQCTYTYEYFIEQNQNSCCW